MILEIDTKFLIEHEISAHQFLLVKLASDGDIELMKKYLLHSDTYNDIPKDMIRLYNAGLIQNPPSGKATFRELKASDRFIKLMSFTGDPFDEFHELFPTKVLRPDGSYDYLRVDRNKCRKMYHNITMKNKTLHDHIMRCLKFEIDNRANTGNMGYFKRMPTWLSSEEWKVSSDRINADTKDSSSTGGKEAYGETFE